MQITAQMVKELRERTGAAMMDCKRALEECKGDMDAAAELMRKSGQAKADKKSARVAAQGVIAIATSDKQAAMVEVNSETDFVAKGDDFMAYAQAVAGAALKSNPKDMEALKSAKLAADALTTTLEDTRPATRQLTETTLPSAEATLRELRATSRALALSKRSNRSRARAEASTVTCRRSSVRC